MSKILDSTRMMLLLKNAVEHIEAFEEDESENVLKYLGFTEDDLTAIRSKNDYSKFSTEDLMGMEKSAYAEYYKLATRPRTNPSEKDLEPLERATATWDAISEELRSRKQPLNNQIQSASARAAGACVSSDVKAKEPVPEFQSL